MEGILHPQFVKNYIFYSKLLNNQSEHKRRKNEISTMDKYSDSSEYHPPSR